MLGRPRTRWLVEEVDELPVRQILRQARIRPAWGPPELFWAHMGGSCRLTLEAKTHLLCGRPSPQPRWYVFCPDCGQRYMSLYELGDRLACRRCLGLYYQSQARRWDLPLYERVKGRTAQLARRPGPKGRAWRKWARRLTRIEELGLAWIDRFERSRGRLLRPAVS
jgi:hypothetical protein